MFVKKEKTNYGKIFAITIAVVAGACAIIFFAAKLLGKYFSFCECDSEDFLDDFEDECCDDEACEICHPREKDDEIEAESEDENI